MVKGSRPPPVWMRKETVEEVALIPATKPLFLIRPLIRLVPLPMMSKPGAKEEAPVPPLFTPNVPVKLGIKVRVLAVLVLIEITMFVSEPVAT